MIHRSTLRVYFKLFIPTTVAMLGFSIFPIIDNFMVFRLGDPEALEASSIANSLFFFPFIVFLGFSNLLTLITTRARLSGDYHRSSEAWKTCFYIGIGFVVIFGGCYTFLSKNLISLLYSGKGTSERTIRSAAQILRTLTWSFFPFFFSECVRRYLQGLRWIYVNIGFLFFTGILNCVLNYALLYGRWGFPEVGLYGVAIATSFSNVVSALLHGLVLRKLYQKKLFTLSLSSLIVLPRSMFKKFFFLGLPSGLEMACRSAFISAFPQVLAAQVGKTETGAITAIISLFRPFRMITLSSAVVSAMLMSRSIVKKDKILLRRLQQRTFLLSLLVNIGVVFLFYLLYPYMKKINPKMDGEVGRISDQLVGHIMAIILCYGLVSWTVQGLTVLQDTWFSCLLSLFVYLIIGMPLSFLSIYYGGGVKTFLKVFCVSMSFFVLLGTYRLASRTNPTKPADKDLFRDKLDDTLSN